MKINQKNIPPHRKDFARTEKIYQRQRSTERPPVPLPRPPYEKYRENSSSQRPKSRVMAESRGGQRLSSRKPSQRPSHNTDLRVPPRETRPSSKTRLSSAKKNAGTMNIGPNSIIKKKQFQLKKDKQLHDKVWVQRQPQPRHQHPNVGPHNYRYQEVPSSSSQPYNSTCTHKFAPQQKSRIRDFQPANHAPDSISPNLSPQQSNQSNKYIKKTSHLSPPFKPLSKKPSETSHRPQGGRAFKVSQGYLPRPTPQRDIFENPPAERSFNEPQPPPSPPKRREGILFEPFRGSSVVEFLEKVGLESSLQFQPIKLYSDLETKSFLVYQVDLTHFNSHRILIKHISSGKSYQEALEEAKKVIFARSLASEVHIHVQHLEDEEGKLALDKEVKASIKGAGFRWKMLVNSENGQRVTIFEAKRPADLVPDEDINVSQNECLEPIKQIGYALLSEAQTNSGRETLSSERNFRAFFKYIKGNFSDIPSDTLRSMGKMGDLINLAKNHQDLNFDGVKCDQSLSTNESINEAIRELFNSSPNQSSEVDLNLEESSLKVELNDQTFFARDKTAMRLRNLNPVSLPCSPFRYIRTVYEKKFILPKTLSPVYIIPTLESDLKILIVPLSSLFLLDSERSKKFDGADLAAFFMASGQEQNEGDCAQKEQKEENEGHSEEEGVIWFPQFSQDSGALTNFMARDQLNSIQDIQPVDSDAVQFAEAETDAVVKGEFVVGIVSRDLLSALKIPFLMTLIKRDHFIEL